MTKQIEIFDPAMCCATGVCGPSVDPELLRVATVINTLTKQGASISRYNLTGQPAAFVSNKAISALLEQDEDVLPVTLIDGEVVKTKAYLTNDEFEQYTGMTTRAPAIGEGEDCCCSDGSCC